MWIASVFVAFIIFSMIFINISMESIFVIAALLLAVIVYFRSFTNRLKSEYKSLEDKYSYLEEELEKLKFSKTIDFIEEETLKAESSALKDEEKIEEVDLTQVSEKEINSISKANYFQHILNKKEEPQVQEEKQEVVAKSEVSTAFSETAIDRLFNLVISYFTKGNPLAKLGGVLLFLGLSFLIKFAVGKNMVSIEMGLISVAVFAFVLIGLGWKYREREGSFGLILQGVGIAIFYLNIFSSAKYFGMMPFSLALLIMVLTIIFASFLAVAQNSMSLAIFASVGGFISPILISTGNSSHVVLFSYYALLNLSIISVAWFKSWRPLNLTGFAFTFVISAIWGASNYNPEFFWSTEPFLIFFFLLYVAVVVIFAFKSEYKLKAYIDSSLLFGVPVTAFAMQGALVKSYDYALSFSALLVAALYISLAWFLRKKDHMSLLAESFLALGVVFITLAIPFAVSEHWTAITWALESTAIIWISLRQNRVYSRYFAVVLQIVAGGVFLNESKYLMHGDFILNTIFLGGILLSVAAFLTSYIFEKFSNNLQKREDILKYIFIALALLWWFFTATREINANFDYVKNYLLAFISLSALLFAYLSKKLEWKSLEEILIGFFPLGLLVILGSLGLDYLEFGFLEMFYETHPFAKAGWFALPLFIFIHYFLLYKFEFKTQKFWHVAGLWLIMGILTWELSYYVAKLSISLSHATYPLVSILAIILITPKRNIWPLKTMHSTYQNLGLAGISFFLILSNLLLFTKAAFSKELGYFPFFNPLDIMQVVSILSILYWLNSSKKGLFGDKETMYIFAGISLISLLTVVLARSVHAFADVRYKVDYLLESYVFQASLSILYSVLALVLIIIAKRRASRIIWIVGATLLGFVTLKLFFVELSHSGTLSRIVSFITVGILILIIGYLAPLPPKQKVDTKDKLDFIEQESITLKDK